MNETTVTVVGTVCSEIRYGQSADGSPTARFQIRNTPRRYDKRTGTWTDGDPNYFSAVCWRTLADHVASSMGVGDPVVAAGRLRISRWRRGEENVVTAELDIQAIGHDLRWGTTVYRQATRPGATRIPGPARRREEEPAPTLASVAAAAAPPPSATAAAELEPAATGAATGTAAGAAAGAGARLAIAPTLESTTPTPPPEPEVTTLPTAA